MGVTESALGSLAATVLALLFVIVVAWVSLRLMRRFAVGGASGGSLVKFVAALPVGPRERVVVIDVGGERLLIGVAAGHVSFLTRLVAPAPAATDTTAAASVADASHTGRP